MADVDVRIPTAADAAESSGDGIARVAHARVTLTVTGGINRPPLERTPGVLDCMSARARLRPRSALTRRGRHRRRIGREFTAALGVPTLDGLGPEGGGAHALDEHVLLEPLAE